MSKINDGYTLNNFKHIFQLFSSVSPVDFVDLGYLYYSGNMWTNAFFFNI